VPVWDFAGACTRAKRALFRYGPATCAPYYDAFVMDKPMAELFTKTTVGLDRDFGTKVFSLNNWNELICWLEALPITMSEEHKAGLVAVYQ
jgi:hypothetical protein